MHQTILMALVVVSIALIVLVAIQPTQSNASSSLNGGAEQLFSKQKARGFESFLRQATTFLGALFIGLALLLSILTSQ